MEIEYHEVDRLKYIKIYNFLKNPKDLRDFLIKFPSEDRTKTIQTGSIDKLTSTSRAPGFQQPIPHTYFLHTLSTTYFNALKYYHMVKYNFNMCKWSYYTNCCYPYMPAFGHNYIPHTDPFSYAANLFLTETESSATDFFKLKISDDTYVYNSKELCKYPDILEKESESQLKRNTDNTASAWKAWDGDDWYVKFHSVPADYNSVTLYRGDLYHSLRYDSEKEKNIRYSLVAALT